MAEATASSYLRAIRAFFSKKEEEIKTHGSIQLPIKSKGALHDLLLDHANISKAFLDFYQDCYDNIKHGIENGLPYQPCGLVSLLNFAGLRTKKDEEGHWRLEEATMGGPSGGGGGGGSSGSSSSSSSSSAAYGRRQELSHQVIIIMMMMMMMGAGYWLACHSEPT